jgi:hypothetical protein
MKEFTKYYNTENLTNDMIEEIKEDIGAVLDECVEPEIGDANGDGTYYCGSIDEDTDTNALSEVICAMGDVIEGHYKRSGITNKELSTLSDEELYKLYYEKTDAKQRQNDEAEVKKVAQEVAKRVGIL